MPDAVQHVQQEPVEDGTVTAGTQQQHAARRVRTARVLTSDGRSLHATRLHSVIDHQPTTLLPNYTHTRANREQ